MEQIITEFISKWGYTAIFILILLENVLPVVPSEIILTFAGLLSVKSHLSIWTLLMLLCCLLVYSFCTIFVDLYLRKNYIDLWTVMVNG